MSLTGLKFRRPHVRKDSGLSASSRAADSFLCGPKLGGTSVPKHGCKRVRSDDLLPSFVGVDSNRGRPFLRASGHIRQRLITVGNFVKLERSATNFLAGIKGGLISQCPNSVADSSIGRAERVACDGPNRLWLPVQIQPASSKKTIFSDANAIRTGDALVSVSACPDGSPTSEFNVQNPCNPGLSAAYLSRDYAQDGEVNILPGLHSCPKPSGRPEPCASPAQISTPNVVGSANTTTGSVSLPTNRSGSCGTLTLSPSLALLNSSGAASHTVGLSDSVCVVSVFRGDTPL